jgi:hypothetical protein
VADTGKATGTDPEGAREDVRRAIEAAGMERFAEPKTVVIRPED